MAKKSSRIIQSELPAVDGGDGSDDGSQNLGDSNEEDDDQSMEDADDDNVSPKAKNGDVRGAKAASTYQAPLRRSSRQGSVVSNNSTSHRNKAASYNPGATIDHPVRFNDADDKKTTAGAVPRGKGSRGGRSQAQAITRKGSKAESKTEAGHEPPKVRSEKRKAADDLAGGEDHDDGRQSTKPAKKARKTPVVKSAGHRKPTQKTADDRPVEKPKKKKRAKPPAQPIEDVSPSVSISDISEAQDPPSRHPSNVEDILSLEIAAAIPHIHRKITAATNAFFVNHTDPNALSRLATYANPPLADLYISVLCNGDDRNWKRTATNLYNHHILHPKPFFKALIWAFLRSNVFDMEDVLWDAPHSYVTAEYAAHLRAGLQERDLELEPILRKASQIQLENAEFRADVLNSAGENLACDVMLTLQAHFEQINYSLISPALSMSLLTALRDICGDALLFHGRLKISGEEDKVSVWADCPYRSSTMTPDPDSARDSKKVAFATRPALMMTQSDDAASKALVVLFPPDEDELAVASREEEMLELQSIEEGRKAFHDGGKRNGKANSSAVLKKSGKALRHGGKEKGKMTSTVDPEEVEVPKDTVRKNSAGASKVNGKGKKGKNLESIPEEGEVLEVKVEKHVGKALKKVERQVKKARMTPIPEEKEVPEVTIDEDDGKTLKNDESRKKGPTSTPIPEKMEVNEISDGNESEETSEDSVKNDKVTNGDESEEVSEHSEKITTSPPIPSSPGLSSPKDGSSLDRATHGATSRSPPPDLPKRSGTPRPGSAEDGDISFSNDKQVSKRKSTEKQEKSRKRQRTSKPSQQRQRPSVKNGDAADNEESDGSSGDNITVAARPKNHIGWAMILLDKAGKNLEEASLSKSRSNPAQTQLQQRTPRVQSVPKETGGEAVQAKEKVAVDSRRSIPTTADPLEPDAIEREEPSEELDVDEGDDVDVEEIPEASDDDDDDGDEDDKDEGEDDEDEDGEEDEEDD